MKAITNEDVMNEHMEKLGINEDDTILDFGCGDGLYTISFAKMLGKNGKIIAMDSDVSKLDKLKQKAKENDLKKRIQIIQSNNELVIPIR